MVLSTAENRNLCAWVYGGMYLVSTHQQGNLHGHSTDAYPIHHYLWHPSGQDDSMFTSHGILAGSERPGGVSLVFHCTVPSCFTHHGTRRLTGISTGPHRTCAGTFLGCASTADLFIGQRPSNGMPETTVTLRRWTKRRPPWVTGNGYWCCINPVRWKILSYILLFGLILTNLWDQLLASWAGHHQFKWPAGVPSLPWFAPDFCASALVGQSLARCPISWHS